MPRYVDGISTYSVNDEGFVYRHKVDNVLINGIPSEPPYVLQWMDARSWLGKCQEAFFFQGRCYQSTLLFVLFGGASQEKRPTVTLK